MATEVLMPKLGLTMTEGTIEEWKYKEGDAVKKGDILFSVATDKLTNDVECEEDGTPRRWSAYPSLRRTGCPPS